MKYFYFFICYTFSLAVNAQYTTNLNLENTTCANWFTTGCSYDPFYLNQNNTYPWRISHGTPQIFTTNSGERGLIIGVNSKYYFNLCSADNNKPLSEGVFFPYVFQEGSFYKITFDYKIVADAAINQNTTYKMDKAWVVLYNGLSENTQLSFPDNSMPEERCYNIPVNNNQIPNSSSQGFVLENVDVPATGIGQNGTMAINSSFNTAEICITPNQTYNQLWISALDQSVNILSSQDTCGLFFLVKNIRINGSPYCDQDLVFFSHEQEDPDLPGVFTKHPFEPIVQAKSIKLYPAYKLSVLPGTTPRPRNTTFQASNFIEFEPAFGNWDSSNVEIQPDGYFEAVIQDCESTFNYCNDYIPWVSNLTNYEPGFFIPLTVNYCSNQYINRIWRVFSVFPRHYNASRIRYDIFERWGGHVYGNEWNKTCDELEAPIDFIKWHYPIALYNSGVFLYQIQLENCHGTKILAGDITAFCATNREQYGTTDPLEDETAMFERGNPNPPKYEITLSPNPANRHVRLTSVSWPMKNIKILNVNGNVLMNHNCQNGLDELVEVSSLAAGVYYANIEFEDQTFSIKFVKN